MISLTRNIVAVATLLVASGVFAQELKQPAPELEVGSRETIDIGVSTTEIAIASDFAGADITVFGALDNADHLLQEIGQYDIVVTLRGPDENATVHKKSNVLGIWINTESMTFRDVPTSFSMASTRVAEATAQPLRLSDIEADIDSIYLKPLHYISSATDVRAFREAFRRQKVATGLYQERPGTIQFVSSSLFKATLRLPADVPNGVHTLTAYLFKSGEYVTQRSLRLRVIKTGLEQTVFDAAYDRSFLYGVFVVLIALFTGYGASVLFRRD